MSTLRVNAITDTTGTIPWERVVQASAQNTTSGTFVDFTGIPSWVKRITVLFSGVSTNGVANIRVQLGTGGTPTTSGYTSASSSLGSGASSISSTGGIDLAGGSASYAFSGVMTVVNLSGNTWAASGLYAYASGATGTLTVAGSVTLSGVLNLLRITTSNGSDTFDAGSVNIIYEG